MKSVFLELAENIDLQINEAKKVPTCTFWKIGTVQIKTNPKICIEKKCCAFILNNKGTVHGLVLHVQLG